MFRPFLFLPALVAAIGSLTTAQDQRASRGAPAVVTFSDDVGPLLLSACGACHHPGGPAPFSLLALADVRRHATQIVRATQARFMPPWKTDANDGPFVGQRQLTDREIALIAAWVDAGAPGGQPLGQPIPRTQTPWQLGTPDLIVTIPQPFGVPADGNDVFRVFVIPIPTERVRYVRGVEFRPGNARVVHHANLRIDQTPVSRRLDAADPAPGYDGAVARSAVYPRGHFLGWTPGQTPTLVPDTFGWTLQPGTDLVAQLHMEPSGAAETVQPQIGFFFGQLAPSATPIALRLGSQAIDIAAGDSNYQIGDSYVLPADVELHALQPHAHQRAHALLVTALLPDGKLQPLLRINEWDFRWQHVYRFSEPRVLPRGTRVSMRFTFDNSAANPRNPDRPPHRVFWGQRTADEMADVWLQLLPRVASDFELLNGAVDRKMTLEDIVGYDTMLRVDPSDADLHNDVALLHLGLGRTAKAIEHFESAARLRPSLVAAHFNLGTAYMVEGRLESAIDAYRRALDLDPRYASAHNNLASALSATGDWSGALRHYREATRLEPDNWQAQRNLMREVFAALLRSFLLPL